MLLTSLQLFIFHGSRSTKWKKNLLNSEYCSTFPLKWGKLHFLERGKNIACDKEFTLGFRIYFIQDYDVLRNRIIYFSSFVTLVLSSSAEFIHIQNEKKKTFEMTWWVSKYTRHQNHWYVLNNNNFQQVMGINVFVLPKLIFPFTIPRPLKFAIIFLCRKKRGKSKENYIVLFWWWVQCRSTVQFQCAANVILNE